MKRVIVIIIDGVGVGELPDAGKYGDTGSDTLGNMARAVGGLNLPNLEKMGLGRGHEIGGMNRSSEISGSYGKMAKKTAGKDSTTGHWELGGIFLKKPFPTYPEGFPDQILSEFTRRTGYGILGNYAASGTEIIKELGEEHKRTGLPIIYTSADSVFQIAAHENVIPLDRLYEICQVAREILTGEHSVARVIARPFTGRDKDSFVRTKYRRDFSLKPTDKTIFNLLQENGISTVGIGKINDLYAYDGIDVNIHTKQNSEGMRELERALKEYSAGYIMANLVDFDMLWGHRNDVAGFVSGLEEFDDWLGRFIHLLGKNDILLITSDHGNDPTTPSTDHSREYVPVMVYGSSIRSGINLGVRSSFADLQASIADIFGIEPGPNGQSFYKMISM